MAFQESMAEALRLTRSGNLMEATALLRSALQPGGPDASPSGAGFDSESPALTSIAHEVQPSMQPRGAATQHNVADTNNAPSQFEDHAYRGSGGTMSYRLYVPANATAGMPLVVMLHGCTQSPEDFARGTGMNRLADEFSFLVAYPRQTQAANPQKCWNWFKPGDQQRDRGEPALLAGLTREVISKHDLDPQRVYVAGLSAGGAAAAIMAAQYPDLFAAVGIHSGLACGAARDLPSALAAMNRGGVPAATGRSGHSFVPVITFHGDKDATVHQANSRIIVDAATKAAGVPLKVEVEEGRSDAGCHYRREMSVDAEGLVHIEQWTIRGGGHAWSGGDAGGSYTDPKGPEASREMVRFFLERKRTSRT
ncbi:PHB depolymerase family esterase [Sphingomonas sp. IC-56]|uniref:extracellular catalytic domain type 1 short-chain-length polyhydroxyalkanoate depolymerase n=1 Tax=Sphingomonas sp. IC-56 TaxID=2898529 RepID=UPI001E2B4BEA|nr:PHB depolymerase family esterase [Sphingomonas sp. IC-56]MCD2325438.1 PHB depolymerase family esterase [Sphingomonas sp. IC-56]